MHDTLIHAEMVVYDCIDDSPIKAATLKQLNHAINKKLILEDKLNVEWGADHSSIIFDMCKRKVLHSFFATLGEDVYDFVARTKVEPPIEPMVNEDGILKQSTIKINGQLFRCECDCNVFHNPDKTKPELYQCNCCDAMYMGE